MEYYKHISELPIANWFELSKAGNIGYMLKCNFFEVPEKSKLLTLEEGKILMDVYFNMPFQFERIDGEIVETERRIAYNQMKYIETDDTQFLNQSRVLRAQLDKKIKNITSEKHIGLIEQTSILNIHLNLNIDIYTCSTAMWFAYRDIFIKQNTKTVNEKPN